MEHKTRIKGNVHYVGVNDRNKHRFEAMWPLPYGVSYNSYLIDDEMVALVDTVDICYFVGIAGGILYSVFPPPFDLSL